MANEENLFQDGTTINQVSLKGYDLPLTVLATCFQDELNVKDEILTIQKCYKTEKIQCMKYNSEITYVSTLFDSPVLYIPVFEEQVYQQVSDIVSANKRMTISYVVVTKRFTNSSQTFEVGQIFQIARLDGKKPVMRTKNQKLLVTAYPSMVEYLLPMDLSGNFLKCGSPYKCIERTLSTILYSEKFPFMLKLKEGKNEAIHSFPALAIQKLSFETTVACSKNIHNKYNILVFPSHLNVEMKILNALSHIDVLTEKSLDSIKARYIHNYIHNQNGFVIKCPYKLLDIQPNIATAMAQYKIKQEVSVSNNTTPVASNLGNILDVINEFTNTSGDDEGEIDSDEASDLFFSDVNKTKETYSAYYHDINESIYENHYGNAKTLDRKKQILTSAVIKEEGNTKSLKLQNKKSQQKEKKLPKLGRKKKASDNEYEYPFIPEIKEKLEKNKNMTQPDFKHLNMRQLTVMQVLNVLLCLGLEHRTERFEENQIDGALLAELDEKCLVELELTRFEARKLHMYINGWRPRLNKSKPNTIVMMSVSETVDFLKGNHFKQFSEFAKVQKIDGQLLTELSKDDLLDSLDKELTIQTYQLIKLKKLVLENYVPKL